MVGNDRVQRFLSEKTPRHLLAIAMFVGVLFLFRHLAILLVFFVTFERAMAFIAAQLVERAHWPRKRAVLVTIAGVVAVVGGLGWLGVGTSLHTFAAMHERVPERIAMLKEHPLFETLRERVGDTDRIVEGAKHYSGEAVTMVGEVGHFFLDVLIGFILAVVFLLERVEIEHFWEKVDARSIFGTMARWLGHLADAIIVTVQLQFIVAACNTLLTLPVLLLIGVKHVGGLMLLIFVSALVPVIGNLVSGAVLCLFAYQAQGWLGVGAFIGLTFVLHKVEAYYLSPRLTARHVKLPGFLLIISLIACEHLFGFKGLFLSFPILFVAGRIRREFVEEDAGVATSPIVLSDSPDQLAMSQVGPISASGLELESRRDLPLPPDEP